jgi:hypothetical protein
MSTNLTSKYVFVTTIPVIYFDSTGVAENSQMQTIFIIFGHLWLVQAPAQVCSKWDKVGGRTPSPLPFASLKTSSPVVPVSSPIY